MKPETRKRKAAEKKAREKAEFAEYNKQADYAEAVAEIARSRAFHQAWQEYAKLKAQGIEPVINHRPWEGKLVSADDQLYLKEMGVKW